MGEHLLERLLQDYSATSDANMTKHLSDHTSLVSDSTASSLQRHTSDLTDLFCDKIQPKADKDEVVTLRAAIDDIQVQLKRAEQNKVYEVTTAVPDRFTHERSSTPCRY